MPKSAEIAQLSPAQRFGRRVAQEHRRMAFQQERDIPMTEIAEAVGASASTVTRWRAGDTMPGAPEQMERLARYLGVSASWLHYGDGERERPPRLMPDPRPAKAAAQAAKQVGRRRA